MSPRQRRGALLVALSAIGVIAVIAIVAVYVSDVRSEVEPKATWLQLTRAVEENDAITDVMVEDTEVPEHWMPETALTDPSALLGKVAASDLEAGSYLQRGMLQAPPAIEPGERELAILVGADTGVAGRIAPGDFVDILATFPEREDLAQHARILVPSARIITVGLPKEVPDEDVPATGTPTTQEVFPVTFAVTPKEGQVVGYAESFAEDVRLMLQPAGESRPVPENARTFELTPAGPVFGGE
jgi:pilus assembly protein CpaB